MENTGNLYPFDYILKLSEQTSLIEDYSKSDKIKALLISGIYNLVHEHLAVDKDFFEIPREEFQINLYKTLEEIKDDLPKIFFTYKKLIDEVQLSEIMDLYNDSKENSLIAKKTNQYLHALLKKNNQKTYTVKEANTILGYSHMASIYNHIRKKNLMVKRISPRKTIINEDDLDEFVQKTYNTKLADYIKLSQQEKKALHKN
ncbi:MAG TPA: hypothetical protein PK784_05480 [Tenuifilaceae bacterium]|nr:hypothetical protein [Tenuifilaceae bacterium]HPN21579.1 hypothetical protein [Tenuifilaceae bacterium]